ncbi:hypothetical protein ADK67_27160 [Saccharothrix sp. NRRL B-16348]|uniref:hypothetical protein n=1 Tax=Saccharothrix sp. NRRL B-16348 TaxID=1415542 RepID=UPI0006B05B31|nr:hypothetical protein [Saccharothrix sp. NRRL B-16348]KOX21383.1 hypothetical protein ADK67_27160 [Saccharothrix sp. NRRL B-16348]
MALDSEGPGTRDVPGPSTSNSVSGTVHGPVAQIGVVHGDVNLVTGAPVKTRYREQVRRIAPPRLIGRETELADLADFCTSSPSPYRWWRAPAWSGKSALMSTFVLSPPTGVRVVSFFITARLAAQNDRNAFIENVLEQLVTILGQDLPPLLTESTREAHLLGLLTEAAEACRDRGEHFVLLVDGLDEDRGVTTGPDAHSIAALLPVDPPAGLRVVVAGRPNPPIPTDVPDHHPLRDPDVVRPLTTSPAAQAERADMERELKRLVHGTPTEQDLLGLLTAAGGGLTAPDLAELTGWSAWDVDDHLRTVTGRSFSRRNAHYAPDRSPDVYLLGHEDLHVKAIDMLGPGRMREYRDRIHDWAGRYHDRQWPADTPEYLLRGYFAMLSATGDLDSMIRCCTDPHRHDRMLEVSGGDSAALAEIAATQQVVLAAEEPDLVTMSRLAVHRDHLTGRNKWLPLDLPSLWAGVGHVDRAEALATSFSDGNQRDRALRTTVEAVIRLGDLDRAVDLASAISGIDYYGDALESITKAAVEGGDLDQARTLVARAEGTFRLVKDARRQGRAMAALARSMIRLGDHLGAERLAASIADRRFRGEALRAVVEAERGDLARATDVARSIEDTRSRGRALQAVAEADDLDRARALALSIADSAAQGRALDTVVRRLVERGELQRALAAAQQIVDTARRGYALVRVAGAASGHVLAARVFDLVLTTARSTTDATAPGQSLTTAVREVIRNDDPEEEADFLTHTGSLGTEVAAMHQGRVLLAAVYAAITASDLDRADALADSITEVRHRSRALHALTEAALRLGAADRAAGYLDRAEALVEFTGNPIRHGQALAWALRAAITADDRDRVERLFARAESSARALPDASAQSQALHAVVQAAIAVGEADRARRLAGSIIDADSRDQAFVLVTRALVDGAPDLAESLAESILTPAYRNRALVAVIRAATGRGDVKTARRALRQAIAVARHAADATRQSRVLAALIDEVVRTGDIGQAEAMADSIAEPDRRSEVLANLSAATRQNDPERADVLLDKAKAAALGITNLFGRDAAISALIRHLGAAGRGAEAEALAYSVIQPIFRSGALARTSDTSRLRARRRGSAEPEPDNRAAASQVHAAAAEGDFEHAEELALSIPDPDYRSHLLESLVRDVIRDGDLERAVSLIARIPQPARQRFAVANVVRAVVATGDLARAAELVTGWEADHRETAAELTVEIAIASGDLDRAEALVGSIATRYSRDDMTGRVADAAIRAGDLDRAEAIVLSLIGSGRSSWQIKRVITAMVAAGNPDRAGRLLDRSELAARSAGEAHAEAIALMAVTEAVIAFGDHDRALELARSIVYPWWRGNALAAVASALLKSGDPDRAGALVDSITTADEPARALHLVDAVEPGPGRRLLARVLASEGRVSDWTSSIRVLCRVAPEALPAMLGELTAIERASGPA